MGLRERIEAEIERREKVARSATGGNWYVFTEPADPQIGDMFWIVSSTHGVVTGDLEFGGVSIERTGDRGRADAEHIALHDPADALRRYAHYRKLLERHDGLPLPDGASVSCLYDGAAWPCPDLVDLAESLGVATVDGGPQ